MRSEKKQGILLSIGKLTTVRKSIIFLVGDRIIVDLYKNICFQFVRQIVLYFLIPEIFGLCKGTRQGIFNRHVGLFQRFLR